MVGPAAGGKISDLATCIATMPPRRAGLFLPLPTRHLLREGSILSSDASNLIPPFFVVAKHRAAGSSLKCIFLSKRLRELVLAARGSQEAGFTQPLAETFALPGVIFFRE